MKKQKLLLAGIYALSSSSISTHSSLKCIKYQDELNVVQIADYLCENKNIINSFSIDNKVATSIDHHCADGEDLKSLTIPYTVLEIGHSAFANNKLTSIVKGEIK